MAMKFKGAFKAPQAIIRALRPPCHRTARCERDDGGVRVHVARVSNVIRRLQAANVGHVNIHVDNIVVILRAERDGLLAVKGLGGKERGRKGVGNWVAEE